MTELSDHQQITGKQVPDLRAVGVVLIFVFWSREFVFDGVELIDEIRDGIDSVGDLWMRAVLNEKLEGFSCTIQNRTDLQPFGVAQLIIQFDSVRCGEAS